MSYLIFIICLVLFIVLSITAILLTYRVEILETELKEKQSLIKASRKALRNAEIKVTERNKLMEYQDNKIKKLEEKINKYEEFITSNNYSNAEVRLQKLKELARPDNQN